MKRWVMGMLALITLVALSVALPVAAAEGDWRAAYKSFLGLNGVTQATTATLCDLDIDGAPELVYTDGFRIMALRMDAGVPVAANSVSTDAPAQHIELKLYRIKKGAYQWIATVTGWDGTWVTTCELTLKGRQLSLQERFTVTSGAGQAYYYAGQKQVTKAAFDKQWKKYFAARADQAITAPTTVPGTPLAVQFDQLAARYAAQGPIPELAAKSIKLSKTKFANAEYGDILALSAALTPKYATTQVAWHSDNEALVTVRNGELNVVGYEGKATITATAGKKTAKCVVTVKRPPSLLVEIAPSTLNLTVGGKLALTASVYPEAAIQTLTWESSDPEIATVSASGVVTGRAVGNVMIEARSRKHVRALVALTVGPESVAPTTGNIKRRAVVISGGELPLDGMGADAYVFAYDALQMRNGFSQSTFTGRGGIETVAHIMNVPTGAEVLKQLKGALKDADEDDVSYVFIQCHGMDPATTAPNYWMQVGTNQDNNKDLISSAQLRDALDTVKGKVVLMLGACHSGSAIGKATAPIDANRFIQAFIGGRAVSKSGELATEKYQVLCAASSTQESIYQFISDYDIDGLANWIGAGFFTEAICKGTGWDLWEGKTCDWQADRNGDGQITLKELETYARQYIIEQYYAQGVQMNDEFEYGTKGIFEVQSWPENSGFVVFEK